MMVARFDAEATWVGLWRGPFLRRGGGGVLGLPGGLLAAYVFSSLLLGAAIVRFALSVSSARLQVVVRKAVSGSLEDQARPGWHDCPKVAKPSGSKGLRGWTFERRPPSDESAAVAVAPPQEPTPAEAGEDEQDAEHVEPDHDDIQFSIRPLPGVSFYDVVALMLKKRPLLRYVITTIATGVEAFCLSFCRSDQGHNFYLLVGLVLIGPLCCLQCMTSVTAAERLQNRSRRLLPCAVVVGTLLWSAVLIPIGSLWLMVALDAARNDSAPSSAWTLQHDGSASLGGAWSVHLVDGFVDLSRAVTTHKICHRKSATFRCQWLRMAPLYVNPEAAGSPTSAWVVLPRNLESQSELPVCTWPGSRMCGLVTAKLYEPEVMQRLTGMVVSSRILLSAGKEPAFLTLFDPDDYFWWPSRCYVLAIVLMLLLSPAGIDALIALSKCSRRRHATEQAGGGEDDTARLVLREGSSDLSADLFAGQALLKVTMEDDEDDEEGAQADQRMLT
eukprot:TRINITY_DN26991_c0_g1_i1.p1 TRINITY_DN26991_c0_g1~~TRINITY_DN26991_c0_g1_i1.p1  ORF type:complete len:501 (+),score=38.16 TRINITY_DN26991_c0_g1_i1:306-1808(+)